MKERAAKLKRLVAVQRQIEHMAELELAELNRDRATVADRMTSLVEALASPDPIHSGFSRLYGRQLAVWKAKDQQLVGRARLQEKRLMSERLKADRLDDNFEDAAAQDAREEADDAVYDILDQLDGLRAQASGKLRRP